MKSTAQDWVKVTGLATGYFALGLSILNLVLVRIVTYAPGGGEFFGIFLSAILAACALLLPNKYLRLAAAVVIAFCCWDDHLIYRHYVASGLLR